MNRPRQRGILILLVIFVAFNLASLFGVVGLGLHSVGRLAQQEKHDIQRALSLLDNAYQMQTAFEQSLVALEAFAQTGDRTLLKNWRDGHAQFQAIALDLQAVLPTQQERRALQQLTQQESNWFVQGQHLTGINSRRQFDTWLRQSRKGDHLRLSHAIDQTILTQRQTVGRLLGQVENLQRLIRWQFVTGLVLLVSTAAVLAIIIRSRIWLPLKELTQVASELSQGNWMARAKLSHDDEFGQLGETLNTMAAQIDQTVRALHHSNEELQTMDRARDDFLSMVTHELKTPLTAITGTVQRLTRGRHGPLCEAQSLALDCIERNASRLLHLVEELLDSTALRQGQLDVTPIVTDYAQLVQDAITQVQSLADGKGIQIHYKKPRVQPFLLDPQRITQVISNLLSNAITATPESGDITVRIEANTEGLLTTVSDTGPGILPEHQHDIFTAFFKLGAKPGSTGLGLSISKALVEAHHGSIGVHSIPGQGATFWFTLPEHPNTPS